MKKRAAALILSVALTAASVAEFGAMSVMGEDLLTSGDESYDEAEYAEPVDEYAEPVEEYTEPEIIIPEEVIPEEPAAEETESEEPAAEESAEDESTAGEISEEDLLSSGEDAEIVSEPEEAEEDIEDEIIVHQVDANGVIHVSESDWIRVPAGYKLIKTTKKSVSSVGIAEVSAEDAGITEDELIDEISSEVLDAEMVTEPAEEDISDEDASEVGAATYYTSTDGIITVSTETSKGTFTGTYYFDAEGIMVTGIAVINAGTPGYNGSSTTKMYFATEAEAELYSAYSSSDTALTPLTSDLGSLKKDFWHYDGSIFRYFDANGIHMKIKEKMAAEGNPLYLEINGSYYALMSNAKPRTGLVYYKNDKYYFDPNSTIPGAMVTGKWKSVTINGTQRWLYFRPTSDGADAGKAEKHTGNFIAKALYQNYHLFDKNGQVLKSKKVKAEDGKTYGSDSKGIIYTNKIVKFGNYRYYFTSSGSLATYKNKWVKLSGGNTGNRYYYFGSTAGRIQEKSGIQKVTVNGKFIGWFDFNTTGNHYRARFVGNRYYDANGKMASGLYSVKGKYYFFAVSTSSKYQGNRAKNKLVNYNNNIYYAQSDGVLLKDGWAQVNGAWYKFSNYKALKNTFAWRGSTYGYLNHLGKFCTGWIVTNNTENKVRYVNPNGNGFYTSTNVVIDGLRYYFDADGYRINDLTNIYTSGYYVTVDRVNGVCTVYDSSRTVPVKSMRISVGAAGTETPLGTYYLRRGGRWQLLMGPSYGQYGTNVVGAGQGGIFFHSIPCPTPSVYAVPALPYSILGYPASHGCIRMTVADAKFIYERCNGATVRIFDGVYNANDALKGPLGKPKLIPMTGSADPTDPLA